MCLWGIFNDNNLGEITGVVTTVLSDVETTAPMVLVNILGGFINSIVFILMVFIFDWRIGYIVLFGIALYLLITSKMERKSPGNCSPKGRNPRHGWLQRSWSRYGE